MLGASDLPESGAELGYSLSDSSKQVFLGDVVNVSTMSHSLPREMIGIVRHIGGITATDSRVKFLGLELCDAKGDSDGSIMDGPRGECTRFFQTAPNHAVFLDVRFGVKKIAAGRLLETLFQATATAKAREKEARVQQRDNGVLVDKITALSQQLSGLRSLVDSLRTSLADSEFIISDLNAKVKHLQKYAKLRESKKVPVSTKKKRSKPLKERIFSVPKPIVSLKPRPLSLLQVTESCPSVRRLSAGIVLLSPVPKDKTPPPPPMFLAPVGMGVHCPARTLSPPSDLETDWTTDDGNDSDESSFEEDSKCEESDDWRSKVKRKRKMKSDSCGQMSDDYFTSEGEDDSISLGSLSRRSSHKMTRAEDSERFAMAVMLPSIAESPMCTPGFPLSPASRSPRSLRSPVFSPGASHSRSPSPARSPYQMFTGTQFPFVRDGLLVPPMAACGAVM